MIGARRSFLLILCGLLAAEVSVAENNSGPLRLTLPAECYAVQGQPLSIYFDNIALTETPQAYRFTVTCDMGATKKDRWMVTPRAADVGDHRLDVTVSDATGKGLGRATTTVRVAPSTAGADRKIRLLIVGDSLTHASLYPNEIARLLSTPGNPTWKMLGTHKPARASEGVAHEGYSGWTWGRFVSKYEPNPDGTHRKRSSPFVYLTDEDQPALDVARYIEKECGGQPPDFVIFLLGINDCFRADPDAPQGRIEEMMKQANKLLAAFSHAAPRAELGICLTTPPNARESSFEENYNGRYTRWSWKRIQHRLVEMEIERFSSREKERLFIVPTQLNLDPLAGYPENNGVHPNALGYQQIGGSVYAWLKHRLNAQAVGPSFPRRRESSR